MPDVNAPVPTRAVFGPAVRNRRQRGRAPAHTVLRRVRSAQNGDIAVARGAVRSNAAHRLGAHLGRLRQGGERYLVAVGRTGRVRGIGPHVIGGVGVQNRHARRERSRGRHRALEGPAAPAMVGDGLVPQHTPCCVGLETRPVILPLPVAVVTPIPLTAWVVTVAACGGVVKLTWLAVGGTGRVRGVGPHIIGGVGSNPAMDDVKAPVAETGPSSVRLPATVGNGDVPQHTPCCVGFGAPRTSTVPLPVAVVIPTPLTAWVLTWGACGRVVKEMFSLP